MSVKLTATFDVAYFPSSVKSLTYLEDMLYPLKNQSAKALSVFHFVAGIGVVVNDMSYN